VATTSDLTVRRPTLADLAAALEVMQAADRALLGESDWTAAGLREEWEELDLDEAAWLVEVDGRLAGVATLTMRHAGRFVADGYVHPGLRGRGVGATLLELTEQAARSAAGADDESPARLQNATLEQDAAPLYAAAGYEPVRHFWRMVAMLDAQPAIPDLPGVLIRNYDEPGERRAVYETLEGAFADHWEHHPRSYEEWSRRHFGRGGFDPTLLWVAEADGAIAGAIEADDSHAAGDWGFIPTLGVLGAYRRRGIAEALLLTAFAELRRRGETRVALGVDAQSPTGATRLYERVGMRVFWEAVVYEKALRG
jgi:mycothiol synthase